MNWLQSFIYGLISGLSEFLPLSPHAHQRILLCLFGVSQRDPVCDLLIHIATLAAVFFGCRELFSQFRRDARPRAHNYYTVHNSGYGFVVRLVRTAVFPLVIGMLILSYIYKNDVSLLSVALFSVINGIILYIPSRMMQGNKDASAMSVFESWIIGLSGALSVFTGFSRVGCSVSSALMRGADRNKALNWALLLSVPAIITLSCIDVIAILFVGGSAKLIAGVLGYFLSAVGAFIGAYCSVLLVRFITTRISYTWFAYYSWGVGLLSFVLYLTVV